MVFSLIRILRQYLNNKEKKNVTKKKHDKNKKTIIFCISRFTYVLSSRTNLTSQRPVSGMSGIMLCYYYVVQVLCLLISCLTVLTSQRPVSGMSGIMLWYYDVVQS